MKPPPFAYRRPTGVDEALDVLAEAGDEAKVLAGGQSLLPLLSMRLTSPAMLVDINRLADLSYVHADGDGVRVGALARHSEVEYDTAAARVQPLLRAVLRTVAHPTIRNRGTTVGSLAHADPAAELPMVLSVLAGSVICRSRRGERRVDASEFFRGILEPALAADELAVEAFFPASPPGTGCAYREVSRRHGDYALCGVGATVRIDGDGAVVAASAGYLSVADTPYTLDLTEAVRGGPIGEAATGRAAELVADRVRPEGDIHASADYRRHLAGVLTRRALEDAYAEAATTERSGVSA